MRYYGVPVQTKIQANTLLLQGNELSASNIIKAVKKQRRYITLERETKEYLKACEAKSIVNQANIKALNDYVINRKTRSLNTTFLANSPVILDGLVLWLDAGVSDSYPAGGTVWKDLAGSNNGTLTNGPTYSKSNGGSIVFDGVDDIVLIANNSTINPTSAITVSAFFRISSYSSNYAPIIFKQNNYNSFYEQYALYMVNTSLGFTITGVDRIQRSVSSNLDYRNIFVHAVATYDTSSQQMKLYINGNLIGTASFTITFDISTNPLRIGAMPSSYTGFSNGSIYNASIYNKALTPAEILQNYNAMKGRFGL